ncbi:MAG: hypothetical protein P8Y96_12045 [Desulfuromonadales bacterium]|jgi:uncharacterized RDD family membrane protein YckC
MLIVLFSAPIFLLCCYLALVCYRQARYQHTLVLVLVAGLMLLITLGVLGGGYFLSLSMSREAATLGK